VSDNQTDMTKFKDHKVTANDLLSVIPEALLSKLSESTKVDYYSKVLHGKKMFYLLLYGILNNERLSQRSLEDTFNDSIFKHLFNLEPSESVRRSSISERLSKIDSNFFKEIYQCIYSQFSTLYSSTDRVKYNLIRVDSSMVYDLSGKLLDGLNRNPSGKKAVKYSIAFDGILPCESMVFTEELYCSEDMALPKVIYAHVKQETGHKNLYVIDRGLQSTRTMRDFSQQDIAFVARLKENRKFQELESLINQNSSLDLGKLTLIQDSRVFLYTGIPIKNKKGNIHYKEQLVEEPFRLIIAKSKEEPDKEYWFVTNEFELTTRQVTDAYRRRWDIEVFFRFIKQELNVSHLVSLNKNGIEVMLYMTLITAMLVLIYKQLNNISYKTAKRRFSLEVRDLAIAMLIKQCGGDPDLMFKT
jgi:transposase